MKAIVSILTILIPTVALTQWGPRMAFICRGVYDTPSQAYSIYYEPMISGRMVNVYTVEEAEDLNNCQGKDNLANDEKYNIKCSPEKGNFFSVEFKTDSHKLTTSYLTDLRDPKFLITMPCRVEARY